MRISAPVLILCLMAGLFLAALGEFCLFGFFASIEPGNHVLWRIGYGLLALFFFSGAIWLGLNASGLRRMVRLWAIVGLTIGAPVAFAASFGAFMLGPRWEALGVSTGVVYGALAAPFGAVVGGVVGICLGFTSRERRGNGTQKSDP